MYREQGKFRERDVDNVDKCAHAKDRDSLLDLMDLKRYTNIDRNTTKSRNHLHQFGRQYLKDERQHQ